MRTIARIAALVNVTSCATSGIEFIGDTSASARLRSDTLALIEPMFMGRSGCEQLARIEVNNPMLSGFLGSEKVQATKSGPIEERWLATGCGKSLPFDVTFTPDGDGGSFISLRMAESASD